MASLSDGAQNYVAIFISILITQTKKTTFIFQPLLSHSPLCPIVEVFVSGSLFYVLDVSEAGEIRS